MKPSFKKPEPRTPWPVLAGTKPAFTSDLCAFYVGDSYKLLDALSHEIEPLRDGKRVHFITDPPYDEATHSQIRVPEAGTTEFWAPGSGELSFAHIESHEMEIFAKAASKISNGWALVFCADMHFIEWRKILEANDFRWRRLCLWVKAGPLPGMGYGPGHGHEAFTAMWRGFEGEGNSVWYGGGNPNTWIGPIERAAQGRFHATQKPLWLMEALIHDFTAPGDLVVDPFAGSATTGVAAVKHGRRTILIERDPKMAALAIERVRSTREQLTLRIPRTRMKQLGLPEVAADKPDTSPPQRVPRRLQA